MLLRAFMDDVIDCTQLRRGRAFFETLEFSDANAALGLEPLPKLSRHCVCQIEGDEVRTIVRVPMRQSHALPSCEHGREMYLGVFGEQLS